MKERDYDENFLSATHVRYLKLNHEVLLFLTL
jgi:hypothetical protein